MSEYPSRPRYFAHRYCRLLAKTCAAQDIGSDGCWMLAVIALLEDSKRYSDAVTFYNGPLMTVTGFTREHTMIVVRRRAVESGWLHYEPGAKRKPGRYWVTVPERFADIPDGACDDADLFPDDSVSEPGLTDDFVSESVGKASVKPQGKRQPFLPIPNPIPKEEPSPNGDGCSSGKKRHEYSQPFEQWWNCYPRLRRKAKLDCSRKYATAAQRVGHEALLRAVQSYATSDEGRGEFCPEPSRWLAKGRYEDDPDTWQSHSDHGTGNHDEQQVVSSGNETTDERRRRYGYV